MPNKSANESKKENIHDLLKKINPGSSEFISKSHKANILKDNTTKNTDIGKIKKEVVEKKEYVEKVEHVKLENNILKKQNSGDLGKIAIKKESNNNNVDNDDDLENTAVCIIKINIINNLMKNL